jgi:hypothetical protein
MAALTNSTTFILKATYVPLLVEIPAILDDARAVPKFGFIRRLNLQPGEVAAVRSSFSGAIASLVSSGLADANFWSLLQQFEGTPLVSRLPSVSTFANVRSTDLATFGNGLTALRAQAFQRLQRANVNNAAAPAAAGQPAATAQSLGAALHLLNTSGVATNAFGGDTSLFNVGMLNLERLEMTPDGVERGALLATIPLAPKERTAVVQQEWSVTSKEFTSIVTDSLENYSETGVTENTQLTQSTTSQVAHANQFNVNASASGGIGFVSGSSATSFGIQDHSSQSATDSRQHTLQTTRKASSRVKQSHKTTISTSTVTGASESTTRMLENPSATDPMRIDYFSLMRKWYVALYRYGLRLTYDITIPEPGAAMREIFAQIAVLQAQANTAFKFQPMINGQPLIYSAITAENYQTLAAEYGVQVPTPPAAGTPFTMTCAPKVGADYNFTDLEIDVPAGYWITDVSGTARIEQLEAGKPASFVCENSNWVSAPQTGNGNVGQMSTGVRALDLTNDNGFMNHYSGKQMMSFFLQDTKNAHIVVTVSVGPTDDAILQWQLSVWNALYSAAQATFFAEQQLVAAQLSALQSQINSVDTLTLRREENDEIMKCVLRWLLGPFFDFMPINELLAFLHSSGGNPEAIYNGVNFTGDDLGISTSDWSTVTLYQQQVNFINQAIDWDNIIYFLYSYFWDIPTSWDFIRQIQHPDSTRQAFMRAGSARVVLTVRKGWELAWTWFVETGSTTLPSPLPSAPYLTIAQQIADYDNANYPGIPPANPNGGGPIDDDTPQIGTTCASDIHPGANAVTPVTIPVASSAGFVVGATAIIDTWNTTNAAGNSIQETQTITAVPDPTHITVQGLLNAHTVANGPFPVVQGSAKGLLIGEWYEYTPTSGTDISIATPAGTTFCDNGQFGNY